MSIQTYWAIIREPSARNYHISRVVEEDDGCWEMYWHPSQPMSEISGNVAKVRSWAHRACLPVHPLVLVRTGKQMNRLEWNQ